MIATDVPFRRTPKNAAGHAPFSASWATWSRRVAGEPVACTRHPAIAIATYSVDQTGPKAAAGGAQRGLRSRW